MHFDAHGTDFDICKERPNFQGPLPLAPVLTRLYTANVVTGDLDGDTFLVLWDLDLIPPHMNAAADYTGAPERFAGASVTHADMVAQFAWQDQVFIASLSMRYRSKAGGSLYSCIGGGGVEGAGGLSTAEQDFHADSCMNGGGNDVGNFDVK